MEQTTTNSGGQNLPPQQTMNNSNTHQVLSIIGLILGVIALIFSFIPCFGMWAMAPGIIGLVFGLIGMSMAGKANASKGLGVAALCVSIAACLMAGYQLWLISSAANKIKNSGYQLDSFVNNLDTAKINESLRNLNITVNDSTAKVNLSTDSGSINININETK
jgi:hypothetical protein